MKPACIWCGTVMALILSGCTNLRTEPEAPDDISLQAREAQLREITRWEMRGRIAVDTGSDAWQGRFNWWQDGDTLRLIIRGPIGGRAVEISGDNAMLTVRRGRETRVLSDPEAQLSEMLGWWLPISSLPTWLLGLPDRRFTTDSTILDGVLLDGLSQRNWAMQYREYETRDGTLIPSGITFTHPPLELVVTIDTWAPADSKP